jgi:hypothetical protein
MAFPGGFLGPCIHLVNLGQPTSAANTAKWIARTVGLTTTSPLAQHHERDQRRDGREGDRKQQ